MHSYLGATFLHSQKKVIFLICVVHRALTSHHCGPGSIPRPGVTCGFSLLLVCVFAPRVFLQVLWFSSFNKNQHSKLQFNLETVNRKSHPRGVPTAKSSVLYNYYYCPTQERHSSSSLFKFPIFCKCTAGNLNRVSRELWFFCCCCVFSDISRCQYSTVCFPGQWFLFLVSLPSFIPG